MGKILAQTGVSLSDVYDVQGSLVAVEELRSEEIQLTHDMGATIFSERVSGGIRRQTSGAIAQSTAFNSALIDFPQGVYRILNVLVIADVAGRVDHAALMLRQPALSREMPLFIWDQAIDSEATVLMVESGGGAADRIALVNSRPGVPSLGVGLGQPQTQGDSMILRGESTAFGAGTVTVIVLVYIAFSQIAGISSIGLPVPGW